MSIRHEVVLNGDLLDLHSVPTPDQAAELIVGLFGEVRSGAGLPDSAQSLLQSYRLQSLGSVGARFFAQYLATGQFTWVDSGETTITYAPKFSSNIPPIRPSNFVGAQRAVSMTHLNYGSTGGPEFDLVFVGDRHGDYNIYYYSSHNELANYGARDPFDRVVNWDARPGLAEWFNNGTKPRLSYWDKVQESNQYQLLAEFSTHNTSFLDLLQALQSS